jgi:hypothetical protein
MPRAAAASTVAPRSPGRTVITEIHLGREARGGNHVTLNDSTNLVIVRCTIETSTARTSTSRSSESTTGRSSTDSAVRASSRGPAKDGTVRAQRRATYYGDWTARFQGHLNQLPIYQIRPQLVSLGGDPNIQIYLSAGRSQPTNALVVEIDQIPECVTWNFQVCNVWFESLDYTIAQVTSTAATRSTAPMAELPSSSPRPTLGFPTGCVRSVTITGHCACGWSVRPSHYAPHPRGHGERAGSTPREVATRESSATR